MPIGRIQLKHGKEESADFGSMLEAEVYYATDTERVMISKGDGTGHYLPSKSEVDEINNRIDDVIATPVPTGEAVAQEIIDSRQGAVSLGANLTSIKNTKADKVEITTHNTSVDAHANMPVNQGFLKDQNSGLVKFWKGTQAQFDGITPDAETIYFVEV